MAQCETCGNDYDKAFQVKMNGSMHTFDSFECAIRAPVWRFRSPQRCRGEFEWRTSEPKPHWKQ